MVEVTSEDWDAAQIYSDLYSGSECYKPSYHQRIGEAFARHHIAGYQQAIADVVEWLRVQQHGRTSDNYPGYYARQIEQRFGKDA